MGSAHLTPVDDLDATFKIHDQAYIDAEGNHAAELAADRVLVETLADIRENPDQYVLGDNALWFAKKANYYFDWKVSTNPVTHEGHFNQNGDYIESGAIDESLASGFASVQEAMEAGAFGTFKTVTVLDGKQLVLENDFSNGEYTVLTNQADSKLFDESDTDYNSSAVVVVGKNSVGEDFTVTAGGIVSGVARHAVNGISVSPDMVARQMADGAADLNGGEGYYTSLAPTAGTGYDEAGMGIDIDTDFSHGSTQTEIESEGEIFDNITGGGLVLNGSNYGVNSVSVNNHGYDVEVNIQISDGSSPGREGLVFGGSATAINEVCYVQVGDGGDIYGPSDIVVMSSITTTFIGQTDFAEVDPLILDLDGDGIELTPFNEQFLFFDVDNDGALERTGWVGADDAILVHDLNGDGDINNITEMLSEYYRAAYGTGAIYANSFEALATLDSNNDGKFDALDTHFSTLRVCKMRTIMAKPTLAN